MKKQSGQFLIQPGCAIVGHENATVRLYAGFPEEVYLYSLLLIGWVVFRTVGLTSGQIVTFITDLALSALLALATEGDFLTPTCPACGVKMTARSNSPYGRKFWGCVNYPRCAQTFFGALNAPTSS